MNETDDELKQWTYEEFCASEYHDLYIELFKRGWTEAKLAKAYDTAIAAWLCDGFTGKPPLKLVLEALLDGVSDEEILFQFHQSLS